MICTLCEREGESSLFEFHHFFPVKTRRKDVSGIMTCHQCADQIHLEITNSELQNYYHTTDRLKERLENYLDWVASKPIETHYSVARKKRYV